MKLVLLDGGGGKEGLMMDAWGQCCLIRSISFMECMIMAIGGWLGDFFKISNISAYALYCCVLVCDVLG